MSAVLVTGATGNVGQEVVTRLLHRGVEVRAAGPHAEHISHRFGAAVTAVTLDFRKPETFAPSVQQTRAVFLMRPPAIANTRETLNLFLEVARDSGVEHVVFLSVAGAGWNRLLPHHATERFLQSSTLRWTILRPGFFSQNFAGAYLQDIRAKDRIFVPAGRARVAFVDARDLAEVAVIALMDRETHAGQAYSLTGGAAVSFAEAAALLSEEVGRRISYQAASVLGYLRHLSNQGIPASQIAVQTILHVGLRLGQSERVDPTLARLLQRPPGSLRRYFADHVDLFRV